MLILISKLMSFLLKMCHIFHLFCMPSDLKLYLGCSKYYIVSTLDSVLFLQRVWIFLFYEASNLIGHKLQTLPLGL